MNTLACTNCAVLCCLCLRWCCLKCSLYHSCLTTTLKLQVFGGLVYMDFNTDYMREHGYGMYQPLDASLLPPLWLMYCDNPSDSGKMHSDVKQRWLRGDAQIQQDMEAVAKCAELGREALQRHDYGALAVLMDQNFNLRRKMFGDAALGQLNLRMIKTARSVGAAAKFTGSGGAVVVYCPAGEEQEVRLQAACDAAGFTLVKAQVAPARVK